MLGKLSPAEATKAAARMATTPNALKEVFKTLVPAPRAGESTEAPAKPAGKSPKRGSKASSNH